MSETRFLKCGCTHGEGCESRCPKHLPKIKQTTPDKCEHKWWKFVGVLMRCMACGAGSDVLALAEAG